MSYECPHCQSENTNKLSISYENGLTQVRTQTAGIGGLLGLFGPAIGVGLARTRGTHQTGTSLRVAPPKKKSIIMAALAFYQAMFLGQGVAVLLTRLYPAMKSSAFILVFFFLVAWIAYLVHVVRFNRRVWPRAMSEWNERFICNRCGEIFRPGL